MWKVVMVDRERFPTEVMESQVPVVVEFFGYQCAPCRLLKPIIDSLAIEFEGRIKFVKVNADEEPALGDYFDVGDLPALALVDHGRDGGQYCGEFNESEIREHLEKWIANVVAA